MVIKNILILIEKVLLAMPGKNLFEKMRRLAHTTLSEQPKQQIKAAKCGKMYQLRQQIK